MNKDKCIIFSPLALLLLLPFNIPLSVFFHTLEPYGNLNPYLLGLAFGGTALLWLNHTLRKEGNEREIHLFFFGLLLAASLVLRILCFSFESDDYTGALSRWFFYIQENDGFTALKYRSFSDYNSVYLYLITTLTYLPTEPLISIKLLSVLFDYFGAFWMFKIIALKQSKMQASIASLVLLFVPTVWFNSSLWAQCDMTYTSFLLMATYFILKAEENAKANYFFYAIIAFACAFLFKLQSIFFIFILLWLYLSKRIPLYYFLIIPLLWFISLIPNWIIGRNIFDLMLIYPRQIFKAKELLSFNAPSVYMLLPNAPYTLFKGLGIFFTLCVTIGMSWYLWARKKTLTHERILQLAALSFILIPFLLPRMHERYFFPADVFLLVLAFYTAKNFWVPTVMISLSLMSYIPFLFKVEPPLPFPILSIGVGVLVGWLFYRFHGESSFTEERE